MTLLEMEQAMSYKILKILQKNLALNGQLLK